jgi:hypothetical protein
MKKLFKKLYESEINLHLSWFWDSGYDVKIGDEMNGYVAEFNTHSIDEVENWVVSNVIKAFPKSKFAKENLKKHTIKINMEFCKKQIKEYLEKKGFEEIRPNLFSDNIIYVELCERDFGYLTKGRFSEVLEENEMFSFLCNCFDDFKNKFNLLIKR